MKTKITLLGSLFLCLSIYLSAQNRLVSGIVYDEDLEALIGANVYIKSGQIGTSTDFDGKFSLEIPADAPLLVSYIGLSVLELKPEELGEDMVVIANHEVIELDEVVVLHCGWSEEVHRNINCLPLINCVEYSNVQDEDALEQRESDGDASAVSSSTKVIEVYPNPSRGPVTIDAKAAMESIHIYDAAGRFLQEIATRNDQRLDLDLTYLPAGRYHLQVRYADGELVNKPFIRVQF